MCIYNMFGDRSTGRLIFLATMPFGNDCEKNTQSTSKPEIITNDATIWATFGETISCLDKTTKYQWVPGEQWLPRYTRSGKVSVVDRWADGASNLLTRIFCVFCRWVHGTLRRQIVSVKCRVIMMVIVTVMVMGVLVNFLRFFFASIFLVNFFRIGLCNVGSSAKFLPPVSSSERQRF